MKPYKIICRDTDSDWLEHRHKYVTASAISSLFGVNPWQDVGQLIAEKASDTPRVLADTPNMWHGRYDEGHNMRKFCDAMGFRSRQTHLMLESNYVPGLSATLDGVMLDSGQGWDATEVYLDKYFGGWGPRLKSYVSMAEGIGLLEMKQTEAWNYKEWKNGPPEYYWYQVQTQLLVSGFPWAVIACQVGAAMFKAYYIEPDHDTFNSIQSKVKEFWNEVALAKEL